jgi:hypothetical protein
MSTRITRPFINTLQFYVKGLATSDRLQTKDFEDYHFSDTILPWQHLTDYRQLVQLTDTLHDQLQANAGPINLKLYTCEGLLVDTIPYSQVSQNYNDPDLYIYEVDVDMSGYPEGIYYMEIEFGNPVTVTLQSEYIDLKAVHENSVLLEYKHSSFREDMIFETGIQPGIRVFATKKFKGPASKNTLYEDQVLNETLIRSVNYRVWTLNIGGTYGIPDYLADKIDRALGCNTVLIDGKYYSKVEGSLDANEVDDYPMRGWKIDLREKLNRASRIIEDSTPQNVSVAAIINVDSKGFGTDTGGSETVISDII